MHGLVTTVFREADPGLRVVAAVDPDQEGVRSRMEAEEADDVVFYPNLDRMVRNAKLDALAIGTRCNLHAPLAAKAAAYDLPLYLEKPVAVSMRQATTLERAFESSRCEVVVSFPLRVSPLCSLAKKHLTTGAVGAPVHIEAANYVPYGRVYWEELYRDYEITRGLFLQKATHDFDYMSYLMNSPITRVSAMATRGQIFGGDKPAGLVCSQCVEQDTCLESPQNRRRRGAGRDHDHHCLFSVDCGDGDRLNEDCSSALVEFASGAHGTYTQVFFALREAASRGASISGYDGKISFDWYTNELRYIRHHDPYSATEQAGAGASHFGGDLELAYDFIDLVHGKGPSSTPIEAGIQSVYACLAAKESAEKGRFVKVRQVGSAAPATTQGVNE
jgi:predicted dehydrogenase